MKIGQNDQGYRSYIEQQEYEDKYKKRFNNQYRQYNVQYDPGHTPRFVDNYQSQGEPSAYLPVGEGGDNNLGAEATTGCHGDGVSVLPMSSQVDVVKEEGGERGGPRGRKVRSEAEPKNRRSMRNLWLRRKQESLARSQEPPKPRVIPLGGKPTKTSELRASYIASKEYFPVSPGGDTSIKAYRGPVDFNSSFTRMRKYSGHEGEWNQANPNKGGEFAGGKDEKFNSSTSNSFSRKSFLRRSARGHKPRTGRGGGRKPTGAAKKFRGAQKG